MFVNLTIWLIGGDQFSIPKVIYNISLNSSLKVKVYRGIKEGTSG
jgi:cyanophycinase-like exopeptidase